MKASPMFNCLPGTMLSWRRMHEWSLGRSCGRALLNDTADLAASHRLFNPVQRWPRFLLAFSRDARLWQPSTSDPVALRQALDRVHQLGYATNLYDAVFYSCLNQFPLSDDAVVQRILVLFSDGEDTGGLHALADAIAQA